MITEMLLKLSEKYDLIKRAEKDFLNYIKNMERDDFEEYHEQFDRYEKVTFKFVKLSLAMNYTFSNEPLEYVQVTLDVYGDDMIIAQYHSLFTLNGEDLDDTLSFR